MAKINKQTNERTNKAEGVICHWVKEQLKQSRGEKKEKRAHKWVERKGRMALGKVEAGTNMTKI